jgi:glycosyltransferase involved in cell wall biosynthesis
MRRLKIGIATVGRFHVLDLARELCVLGHDVSFYSIVPRRRARKFGLPDACYVSLLPFVLPFLFWERVMPGFARKSRERFLFIALNYAVMLRLRRCDLFIFMSGIYLEAPRFAKWRYGARLWLERGSQHILSQDEILAKLPGAERPTALVIKRELAGYKLADRIVIASKHVEESFRGDPFVYRKLFRSPYGVDTDMFPQREARAEKKSIVLLYVGSWSLRKGCDVIVEAISLLTGISLVHVGGLADFPFPVDSTRFVHFDAVPQWQLAQFYADADGFVFASREDGFGMVLSHALATGLPVIATDRTGAPDLALTPDLARRITVIPHGDARALADAITALRDRLLREGAFQALADDDRDALSWAAYGRRYNTELLRDLDQVAASR